MKQSFNTTIKLISMDEMSEDLRYDIKEVHISEIRNGDTILHIDGRIRTVGNTNIRRNGFTGTTLFGDSYKSGVVPVKRLMFRTINEEI